MTELYRLTAREAVDLLRRGEVSPLEMIEAALARIAAVEPRVNALPTLCAERARAHAGRLMRLPPAERGPLAGLPVAVKDLIDVAGVRTTYGSSVFADHVPERSNVLVERLERNGAVVLAKSNTPEFGSGANTFNDVFGKTRNPWNTALTCGGSSGGSAVAVATGEVWLAHGSDFGCSLRVPASFCGVVGLRPSPGRVARAPVASPFDTMWVEGPVGRTVGDVALMLDAMTGADPMDPLSFPTDGAFVDAVDRARPPGRVAYSPDLGGLTPVDREVAGICAAAAGRLGELGAKVDEAAPDLGDAHECFRVLRAYQYARDLAPLLEEHRDALKREIVWNIEEGLKLTAEEVARAERMRNAMYERTAEFFRTYDLLITPAAIVPPFDVDTRYVSELDGHGFDTYYGWFALSYAVTLVSCPALSVPCGFTASGLPAGPHAISGSRGEPLPVGPQFVGPPRGEAALLAAAGVFEEVTGIARRLPVDPRPATAAP